MINILFTRIPDYPIDKVYNEYLELLPTNLKMKNCKYHKWQDRYANLFGKILLLEGLDSLRLEQKYKLEDLQYNRFGRPGLSNQLDFNISHSGQYVVCAISEDTKVGIDIEQIRELEIASYESTLNTTQKEKLKSASSLVLFFEYWTIKESVAKANGRGLSIPFDQIQIKNDMAIYENTCWNFKKLNLNNNYITHVASDAPLTVNTIIEKYFF